MLRLSKIVIPFIFVVFTFVLSFTQTKTGSFISSVFVCIAVALVILLVNFFENKILKYVKVESLFFCFLSILISIFIVSILKDSFKILDEIIIGLLAILTFIGIKVSNRFGSKLNFYFKNSKDNHYNQKHKKKESEKNTKSSLSKVLDTSVIIDGRILNIVDTNFIDGNLIVPNFVLREIQLISDSSDAIKRSRGRRGLDMLKQLQEKKSIKIEITYEDFLDTKEVDAKLVKLAKKLGCKIITNDFNLHQVAELQGVDVLNLNKLANSLKSVILPGENFNIQVIKEGKDENQGIGYLEEGTMVVIESGGNLVGNEVNVSVTSVIQTSAGKMVFTKLNSKRS